MRRNAQTAGIRIDLHVHTRRYSPCAELLDPAGLAAAMEKKLIQGVVITEHDNLWPAAEIRRLNADCAPGSRIFRGIEVSCDIGHFIIIGLPHTQDLYPGMPVTALVKLAVRNNAAVIVVHPQKIYRKTGRPVDVAALPQGIHAIETMSTFTRGPDCIAAARIAALRQWAAVAGSDAHCLEQIGTAVTVFRTLPDDEQELAAAIRKGSGTPQWYTELQGQSRCC